MIFVTVGSAPHSFKRLVQKMDEIASEIDNKVVIQKGFTSYQPARAASFDFVDYADAISYFEKCEVVISHASAGPVLYARKFEKPLIIVPRNGSLKEHVDNHQMETAKALENSSEMIEIVYHTDDLSSAIRRALLKSSEGLRYEEAKSLKALVECVAEFVEDVAKKIK